MSQYRRLQLPKESAMSLLTEPKKVNMVRNRELGEGRIRNVTLPLHRVFYI